MKQKGKCRNANLRLQSTELRLAPVKRETGANPVRTRHRDREQKPQNHWETGKMADAMILSRETCLNAVQKRKFQTTSKKVVRLDLQVKIEIKSLQVSFSCSSLSDSKRQGAFFCSLLSAYYSIEKSRQNCTKKKG